MAGDAVLPAPTPAGAIWARFIRPRRSRWGLVAIAVLFLAAALADFAASEAPIFAVLDGRAYLLPNLTRPPALRPYTLADLRRLQRAGRVGALVPPLIPYGPEQTDISAAPLAPPSRAHWLGTDGVGRDVAAQMVHGARVSLLVGLLATGLAALFGLLVGTLAGYYGGAADVLLSRGIEVVQTFPTLFLVLFVMAMLPRPGLGALVLVLGITGWTGIARLARAEAMRLKRLDFVAASRALGGGDLRAIWRHVVPNALGPVLVAASLGVGGAVLTESALSFLGLGAPPGTSSWGALLMQARDHPGQWWLAVFPGAAIFVTVAAYNAVGEGLRDALDPRSAG